MMSIIKATQIGKKKNWQPADIFRPLKNHGKKKIVLKKQNSYSINVQIFNSLDLIDFIKRFT